VGLRGLGELERAVMACVWAHDGPVTGREVVDELARTRPIAYTTVLTVMDRLADKGLLVADATLGKRAYDYRPAGTPTAFLAAASRREAQQVLDRYGDAALAAFAARLDDLTPQQRKRLEDLEGR